MSLFRLAQFDDVEWVVHYLKGKRNIESDALSRPPMLGPLRPAVDGIVQMLRQGMGHLPGDPQQYKTVFVCCDSDNDRVAKAIRDWRGQRGTITKGGHTDL